MAEKSQEDWPEAYRDYPYYRDEVTGKMVYKDTSEAPPRKLYKVLYVNDQRWRGPMSLCRCGHLGDCMEDDPMKTFADRHPNNGACDYGHMSKERLEEVRKKYKAAGNAREFKYEPCECKRFVWRMFITEFTHLLTHNENKQASFLWGDPIEGKPTFKWRLE